MVLLCSQSRFYFAHTTRFIAERDFFRGWAVALPVFHGHTEWFLVFPLLCAAL